MFSIFIQPTDQRKMIIVNGHKEETTVETIKRTSLIGISNIVFLGGLALSGWVLYKIFTCKSMIAFMDHMRPLGTISPNAIKGTIGTLIVLSGMAYGAVPGLGAMALSLKYFERQYQEIEERIAKEARREIESWQSNL